MAEKTRDDGLRLGQRNWRDYGPIAQARRAVIAALGLLARSRANRKRGVWASLRLSTPTLPDGYRILRLQISVVCSEDAMAEVLAALPNYVVKTSRRNRRRVDDGTIPLFPESDVEERSTLGSSGTLSKFPV